MFHAQWYPTSVIGNFNWVTHTQPVPPHAPTSPLTTLGKVVLCLAYIPALGLGFTTCIREEIESKLTSYTVSAPRTLKNGWWTLAVKGTNGIVDNIRLISLIKVSNINLIGSMLGYGTLGLFCIVAAITMFVAFSGTSLGAMCGAIVIGMLFIAVICHDLRKVCGNRATIRQLQTGLPLVGPPLLMYL